MIILKQNYFRDARCDTERNEDGDDEQIHPTGKRILVWSFWFEFSFFILSFADDRYRQHKLIYFFNGTLFSLNGDFNYILISLCLLCSHKQICIQSIETVWKKNLKNSHIIFPLIVLSSLPFGLLILVSLLNTLNKILTRKKRVCFYFWFQLLFKLILKKITKL